jgi:thiamine-phosphate diphosphorylase
VIRSTEPWICLVTDRRQVAPDARTSADELRALDRWLDEALTADLDLLQIRERDLEARDLIQLAERIVGRRAGARPRIVVNERADVALAAGLDGVHVRADGPPTGPVRALGPAGWIVGRSVHTQTEISRERDASYVLFGTVFSSRSKDPGAPVQGVAALAEAVAVSPVPVLAIGGMTPDTVALVRSTGIAGVAAIGVFLPVGSRAEALGPRRGAAALRAALLRS